MIDEKELSAALRDLADRDEAGSPPVADLLHRGRRARAGRVVRGAAVMVVAAALVTAVAVAVRPAAPTAPVPLALAAQTTERTTFHFRVEFAYLVNGAVADFAPVPWDGRYDPVHDRGYMTMTGIAFEIRQLGSRCFSRNGPAAGWKREARCWRIIPAAAGREIPDPADPGALLAEFRKSGRVTYVGRTGAGPNAVDSYRFVYPIIQQIGGKSYVVDKNGTVDIDVANRRITRVVYLLDNNPEKRPGLPPQFLRVVMRFDEFGTPVDVPEPRT
jgi:hypothetical protein